MRYYEGLRMILAMPKLTPGAKVVLLYFYDRQGRKRTSWPSISTICKDCGLARASSIRAVKELEDNKLVKVLRPTKPSIGKTNKYSVCLSGIKPKPVHELNQFRNDTGTGVESIPELVSNLNPNVSYNDSLTNSIRSGEKNPAASRISEAETAFESARQLYPGTKRSGVTELKDFQRHKDWKSAASLLAPAIQREIEHKSKLKASEKFCPEWKNFKSWICQRCWEQEFPDEDDNQLTHECDPDVAMALERSLMHE